MLVYSTYLGGSDDDYGLGISVDTSGNTYITGMTASKNFPTRNAMQSSKAGLNDVFVTKLSFNSTGAVSPVGSTGTMFDLNAVTPNPATNEVQISYLLPEEMSVTLELYTSDGRLAATPLKSARRTSGAHSESISVAALVPGAYSLRLMAGANVSTQRFMIVR